MSREERRFLYPSGVYNLNFRIDNGRVILLTFVKYERMSKGHPQIEWELVTDEKGNPFILPFSYWQNIGTYQHRKFQQEKTKGFRIMKKKVFMSDEPFPEYKKGERILSHLRNEMFSIPYERFVSTGYHVSLREGDIVNRYLSSHELENELYRRYTSGEDLTRIAFIDTNVLGPGVILLANPEHRQRDFGVFIRNEEGLYLASSWMSEKIFTHNPYRAMNFRDEEEAIGFMEHLWKEQNVVGGEMFSFAVETVKNRFLYEFTGGGQFPEQSYICFLCTNNTYERVKRAPAKTRRAS